MSFKGFIINKFLKVVSNTTATLSTLLTTNGEVAHDSDKDKLIIRSNGINDPIVSEARAATLDNKTLNAPALVNATGTLAAPVITGGTITGAGIDGAAITDSTITLNDTASANTLAITSTSNPPLTGNRALTLDVNNGNRSMDLAGNLTLANNLATAGDFPQTLTATASTNVTLPVTGTLATLAGAETLTNKTISGGSINSADIDGQTASNTSRITLPKASKTVLDGLTRKQATIVYASDQDTLYFDNGSSLAPLGGNFVTYNNQNVTAGGTVTISLVVGLQMRRVTGSPGAVTLANAPFGSSAPADGTVIRLIGLSDTLTVSVVNSDTAKGCLLNGDCVLGLADSIDLQYDSSLDRYIEVARASRN